MTTQKIELEQAMVELNKATTKCGQIYAQRKTEWIARCLERLGIHLEECPDKMLTRFMLGSECIGEFHYTSGGFFHAHIHEFSLVGCPWSGPFPTNAGDTIQKPK